MPTDPTLPAPDVVARLCLEAGRIMEDNSVELALILPKNRGERAARLQRLQQAGSDIVTLAAAAQALHRRYCTE